MPWSQTRRHRRRINARHAAVLNGDVWALIPTVSVKTEGLEPIVLDGDSPKYLHAVPMSVLATRNGQEHRDWFTARDLQIPNLLDVKNELHRRRMAKQPKAA